MSALLICASVGPGAAPPRARGRAPTATSRSRACRTRTASRGTRPSPPAPGAARRPAARRSSTVNSALPSSAGDELDARVDGLQRDGSPASSPTTTVHAPQSPSAQPSLVPVRPGSLAQQIEHRFVGSTPSTVTPCRRRRSGCRRVQPTVPLAWRPLLVRVRTGRSSPARDAADRRTFVRARHCRQSGALVNASPSPRIRRMACRNPSISTRHYSESLPGVPHSDNRDAVAAIATIRTPFAPGRAIPVTGRPRSAAPMPDLLSARPRRVRPKPAARPMAGGARIARPVRPQLRGRRRELVLHGDAASEQFLSEIIGAQAYPARHLSMESIYEYGSRAGVWRILREFERRALPLTVFGVAMALERTRRRPRRSSSSATRSRATAGAGSPTRTSTRRPSASTCASPSRSSAA